MPVKFIPTGTLDITTNPALLPEETDGKSAKSGAMRRCTNLRIDEQGVARTRFGSTKGATQIHAANAMIELSGDRYEFGGDEVYKNESSLITGLTDAAWTATIARPYNSTTDAIYATNGTDRKRIESGAVYEWGITPPSTVLTVENGGQYAVTYDWEKEMALPVSVTTSISTCEAVTGWSGSVDPSYTPGTVSVVTWSKEGTYAIRGHWPVGEYDTYIQLLYDIGSGTNFSGFEYIGFWCARTAAGTDTGRIIVQDTGGNMEYYDFTMPAIDTWGFVTAPKNAFASLVGAVDWTVVQYVYVQRQWSVYPASAVNLYIDAVAGYTSNLSGSGYIFTRQYDDTDTHYDYTYSWEDNHLDSDTEMPIADRAKMVMRLWEYGSQYIGAVYYLKYTYCRKSGDLLLYESNPSIETSVRVNNAIIATWDAPSDSQITHVRIYRTELNGTTYYYDSEWPVSYRAVPILSTDDDLGTVITEDNDRPPLGTVVAGPAYGGYLFMAYDNCLYWSKGNQPDVWPSLSYVEVSPPHQPIKALCVFAGLLYAFTEFGIYQIQGTSTATFYPIKMTAHTGAKNQYSVAVIPNHGILHIGNDGIYLWNTNGDTNITKAAFNTLFFAQTSENVPYLYETYLSRCFFLPFKDKVFFFYPESTDSYPSNLLVFDLRESRTVHYDYGTQFTAGCVDYTNDRLYVCDSSGYVWQLENESATTDNGTAISWQIQSKTFADTLYKYFPRYAKYDVTVGTGGTAKGDILLNEESKQTHTLTGSRLTRKRLVTGCTGDRLSVRLTGTGTITIYGLEVE
jgi:hypothetical protein